MHVSVCCNGIEPQRLKQAINVSGLAVGLEQSLNDLLNLSKLSCI